MPEPSQSARRRRLLAWVVAVAGALLAIAGLVLALAAMTIDRSGEATAANLAALWPWWLAGGALWLVLTGIAALLATTPADAIRLPTRTSVALILATAAAARLAVVLTSAPHLSDDLWRYVHDGATLAAGGNPYALAPADASPPTAPAPATHAAHEQLVARINHPAMVTIYQPAGQWTFAALWSLHPPTADPLADRTFRLAFVLVDLLVIALLMRELLARGRSAWWVVLYAWHPLAITEVAHSGHQDVLGIAMLLAGLAAITRVRGPASPWLAGLAFAAAVAVKPIVLPLAVPGLLYAWRARGRRPASSLTLAAAGAGVGLYAPFALMPGGLDGLFATARTFARHWQFNGSLHPLLMSLVGDKPTVDLLLGGALLGVLGGLTWRCRDLWLVAFGFLFAGVLLTSTAHPWYLLWSLALLPLVPLRPAAPAWVLSLTMTWSYVALARLPAYDLPSWLPWVEYLPVYAALLVAALPASRDRSRLAD